MRHPPYKRRGTARTAGHTLIELMVVMFVIAMAASLVLPIMVRSYSSFKIRMAADSIVKLLRQAKSRSLYESRTYLVIFPEDTTNQEIILTREDGATVGHYALPAGISIRRRNAEDDWSSDIGPVAFFPDGSSEGLLLAIQSPTGSLTRVLLDPWTGQAKILLAGEDKP